MYYNKYCCIVYCVVTDDRFPVKFVRYYINRTTSLMVEFGVVTYRTSAVTHPDVAFNVKRRWPGESERFHVGEHLGFKNLAFAPRSSKSADQLVVDGASAKNKQNMLFKSEFKNLMFSTFQRNRRRIATVLEKNHRLWGF